MSRKIIEHLKLLTTQHNTKLSIPIHFFLDNISENSVLFGQSKPFMLRKEYYDALLSPVVEYYEAGVTIKHRALFQLVRHRFIHGTLVLSNGKMVMFYFFEDVEIGMAAVPAYTGGADIFRLIVSPTLRPC